MTHPYRATEKITNLNLQIPIHEIWFDDDGVMTHIIAYDKHEGHGVYKFSPSEVSIDRFTGQYDQNNTPIYENDLVRVGKPNSYLDGQYLVRWNNQYSMWGYFDLLADKFVTKGNGQPYIINQYKCEVLDAKANDLPR